MRPMTAMVPTYLLCMYGLCQLMSTWILRICMFQVSA